MKCPTCKDNKLKSKVWETNRFVHLMGTSSAHFDEDGVWVPPCYPITTEIDYVCNMSHRFQTLQTLSLIHISEPTRPY